MKLGVVEAAGFISTKTCGSHRETCLIYINSKMFMYLQQGKIMVYMCIELFQVISELYVIWHLHVKR